MTSSINVQHPGPEALRHLLGSAGYLETKTTERYSIFSKYEPAQPSPQPGTQVSPAASPMDKLLFTPEEAARYLSIGRTKIYELIAAGCLVSVRVGKCRRIPASALLDFVDHLYADVSRGSADPRGNSEPGVPQS